MPWRALLLFVLLLPTGVRAWLCDCRGPLAGVAAQSCCDELSEDARRGGEAIATTDESDRACCDRVELPRSTTPTVKADAAPEVPSLAHAPTAIAFQLVHADLRGRRADAARPAPRAGPPHVPIPLRL